MQKIDRDASKGLVTSRDPSTLESGELTEAVGGEYRVGSPHFYKLPGRVDVGESLDAPVLSLKKLQYDQSEDIFVADAGGIIYERPMDSDPPFISSGVTGLSTTAVPQYTGVKNLWIRCDGTDDNLIREGDDVPGGTQGNWRVLGMQTAGLPIIGSIIQNAGGGQVLRPTTFSNQPYIRAYGPVPQTSYNGYRYPQLAIDAHSGVGSGTVSGASGQVNLTGVNTLFTTQLSIGAILTFADGSTATVSTILSNTLLTTSSNLTTTLVSSTYIYTNSTSQVDSEETQSLGFTGDCLQQISPLVTRTCICTWAFSSNLAYSNRVLAVKHAAAQTPSDWGAVFGEHGMEIALEYTLSPAVQSFPEDATGWLPLGEGGLRLQPFPNTIEDSVAIADNIDISTLRVRAFVTSFLGKKSGKWLDVYHAINDIKVSTGAVTAYTAENPIQYGVSEAYVDSDGVEHQSNMGTTPSGTAAVVQASQLQNAVSLTLIFPQVTNPLSTKWIIWRSIDVDGGGYPAMYRIAERPITDTSWVDTFTIRPDDAPGHSTLEQYQILEILYSTGESSTASAYTAPPKSFMSLVFQGSVCYFPSDPDSARRIYYSLPATVSTTGIEQVPEQYYLDFQTPFNDQVKSGAITNGGRSMLAFFENYTMLVNFLPQGADPGGFNNVVKEYVSNVRGCAGKLACTEFTLPSGQTLVASVDALGLWVTNGVNMVDEWSLDLEWDVAMADVDLSTIELYDKPHKRRIEMLFTAADGTHQEYHFFYGRMKQSARNPVPMITGPHPTGVRCKLYTVVDTKWEGFTGSASAEGLVFHEDEGFVDEANGYDDDGNIPWAWTGSDIYPEGITRANILEQINMKFSDGSPKNYTVNITAIRDKGSSLTKAKNFAAGSQQQIYVHQQLDRVRVQIQDISNTESSAFVGMAYEFRDSGPTRNK